VPTWNLRTPKRQSLQTAAEEPEELSASFGAGATLNAMMSDRSLGKARVGRFSCETVLQFQVSVRERKRLAPDLETQGNPRVRARF